MIPTAFRIDHMSALRRMTRQDDPLPLIRALDRAQDFISRIDFTDYCQWDKPQFVVGLSPRFS